MKKYVYALTNENNEVVATSNTPIFGWETTIIDDGIPEVPSGEQKLIEKYRALCNAETTETGKNKVRKDFVIARKIFREECAKRKIELQNRKVKLTNPVEQSTKLYWQLDNQVTDKVTGESHTLRKNIVVRTGDPDKPWAWKAYLYDTIAKSPYYGKLYVQLKDNKMITVAKAIEEHKSYAALAAKADSAGRSKTAATYRRGCARLKQAIDAALDKGSKSKQDALNYTAKRRIAMINRPIVDDDTIIACYPIKEQAYNGEITEVACGRMLVQIGTDYATGEEMYQWTDGNFINTNQDVKFDSLLCDPNYAWLYAVIEKAKTFGFTPRTEEGVYKSEGFLDVVTSSGATLRVPQGIRGMCITVGAANELNTLVNYFEGNADLGKDFSDTITLHHTDGIRSHTTTEYNYQSNKESYLDWKQTERRDFQWQAKGKIIAKF